jgi:hypothetical protein|tara:strand:- start:741 stop:920 length:180 start_codon:yes stop_codon:yes gene_type:complete
LNKKNFYINTPEGDTILAEVFLEDDAVTLLIGEDYRIDLDADSAYELADCLLLVANESD